MSKRIKYAKLRLAKPNDATNASGGAGEQDPEAVSVGGARNCKTSKYFSDELKEPCSSSQSTFEEIDIEPSGGGHEEPKCGGENSRRRSVEAPEPSTSNGPKLPKLRRTRGNVLISNFLNSQTDTHDDDFEEQSRPAPVTQKPPPKAERAAKKGSTTRRGKIRNQLDIRNVFKKFKTDDEVLQELLKEHSASEHVDPEQLQLALAMSRSLADRGENSNHSAASAEDHTTSSLSLTEHRIVGIRTTLEQFGFRCKNSYTDYDLNIIFGSARCKNVKKIKHKRATNLVLRSEGELTEFINAKVRDFFPDMLDTEESVCSIRFARSRLTHLFWIAQAEQESIDIIEKYYVSELVDVNPAPVGCMLKDWSKIPGREATPEREISAICREHNESLPGKTQTGDAERTSSPDLFEVYDEDSVTFRSASETVIEQKDHETLPKFTVVGKEFSQSVSNSGSDASSEENIKGSEAMTNGAEELNCDTAHGTVIVIDGDSEQDDQFFTAPEMPQQEEAIYNRSSENMFDDTDPDPIVSFEVYSSEEEKISAASQAPARPVTPNDDTDCAEDLVLRSSATDFDRPITFDEPCRQLEVVISADTVLATDQNVVAKEPLLVEKELSFHRIAIKARLSEALGGSDKMLETVNLVEEPEGQYLSQSQRSQLSEAVDEVLEISDDEVNYSMQVLPRPRTCDIDNEPLEEEMASPAHEDPDTTIICQPRTVQDGSLKEMDLVAQLSSSNVQLEEDVVSVSSNDSDAHLGGPEGGMNCPESTIAYLDNLVKEFNLPPLRPYRKEINVGASSNRSQGEHGLVFSVDEDEHQNANLGVVHKERVEYDIERLSNYIETYETPDIDEQQIVEAPRDGPRQRDGPKKGFQKIPSCTQFDSPRLVGTTLKRTASESGTLSSSTPKEREEATKMGRFVKKFDDLKVSLSAVSKPEYIISTLDSDLKPPDFETMTMTEIERELFKYGLKTMNRMKAIKVLQHIFNELHPFVELVERQQWSMTTACNAKCTATVDRRNGEKKTSQLDTVPRNDATRPRVCAFRLDHNDPDLFLPSKPRKKMAWCAVPLHVAFFNLVSESEVLQRQILRYEPVSLDNIYATLKDTGLRYETNDLIAFLDKHCITFRSGASGAEERTKTRVNYSKK